MENTTRYTRDLIAADPGEGGVLDKLARMYEQLDGSDYLPPIVCEMGRAWCRDVAKLL